MDKVEILLSKRGIELRDRVPNPSRLLFFCPKWGGIQEAEWSRLRDWVSIPRPILLGYFVSLYLEPEGRLSYTKTALFKACYIS